MCPPGPKNTEFMVDAALLARAIDPEHHGGDADRDNRAGANARSAIDLLPALDEPHVALSVRGSALRGWLARHLEPHFFERADACLCGRTGSGQARKKHEECQQLAQHGAG